MARTVLTISETELLDALAGAIAKSDGPQEAKTAKEIAESTGRTLHSTMQALHAINRQGRLGVFKVKRSGLDGVSRTVTGYTVLTKPKK